MTRFSPHLDILPHAQRALWPKLRAARDAGFVLYGGTAIAIRLGHRQSIDFDFFSDHSFAPSELRSRLHLPDESSAIQSTPNTLRLSVNADGNNAPVMLSFFGGLDFGRVGDPEETDDGVLLVASLDDLMATKLKVLHDRVEAKDYVDIAAMIRHGVSLARGLAAGRALYGSVFDPMIALRAVTWFEDGDLGSTLSDEDKTLLRTTAAGIRSPLPVAFRRSHRIDLE